MVASKYYVYGGGRWRELDTASGRVSGWRGARLCVARRGRMAVQRGSRRARLLAALRALAAGRASHARDGPRLHQHQTRHECVRSAQAPSRSGGSSRCRCCCHHNGHICEGKLPPAPAAGPARSQRSMTSDACTQAGPPPPPHPPPRLAFPTSALRCSPRVKAKVQASTPIEKANAITVISSGSHHSQSSSDSAYSPVNNKNASQSKKPNSTLKRKRILSNSNSTESSEDVISPSQSILKKDYNAKYLRPRKAVRRTSPTRVSPTRVSPTRVSPTRISPKRVSPIQDRPPRIRTRVIPGRSIQVSSDNENKDPTVDFTTLKDSKTKEQAKNKSIDIFSQRSQKVLYRELVISEEDVVMVRQFMLKSDPTFDLYLYDSDDAYKARFFYSINPLVSIARCARIAAMLEGQTRLSLRQFASQLGLRSVSDVTAPAPARRHRTRRTNVVYRLDTESSDDKEPSRRSLRNHSGKPNVKQTRETEINSDSSEDKENFETSIRRSERQNRSKRNDDKEKVNTVTVIDSDSSEDEDTIRRGTSIRRSDRRSTNKPNRDRPKENHVAEINSDSSESEEPLNTRSDKHYRKESDVRQKENLVSDIDTDSLEDKENFERSIRRSLRHNSSKLNNDRQKEKHVAEINKDSYEDKKNSSEDKENLETSVNESDRHNPSNRTEMPSVTVRVERLKEWSGRTNTLSNRTKKAKDHAKTRFRSSTGQFLGNVDPDQANMDRKEDPHSFKKNLKRNIDDNTEPYDNRPKRQRRPDKQETSAEQSRHVDAINETNIHNRQNNNNVKTSDVRKKQKPRPNEEFRSKEYSSLEDHTIVAWISQHNRARLVNGNRVWRLLEVSYEELAGRARSWHSLRNRYLRYLLPTLGALQLPPRQQTRLRAAAALGEMKGKKLPQRRASIFGQPPARGASSRKPGPPPETPVRQSPRKPTRRDNEHSGSDEETLPESDPRPSRSDKKTSKSEQKPSKLARSPRYSEVIRQFAARHRHSSSSEVEPREPQKVSTRASGRISRKASSSESETELRRPTTRASGVGASGSKTRQLYNPNKL